MTAPHASISVFTGAGGLDLGLEAAGFAVKLCVENDDLARATLKQNRPRWSLAVPGDILQQSPGKVLRQAALRKRQVTLLAGGPPCQPWSKSGQWAKTAANGWDDPRARTINAYLELVEGALPQVVLLENVNRLASSANLDRLRQRFVEINSRCKTDYKLSILRLNAADYGIPQQRQRVFIIADRSGKVMTEPKKTHGVGCPEAHRTAWDAIGHLDATRPRPDLAATGQWADLLPSIPEGNNYLWHTSKMEGDNLFGWRTKYWSFLLKLAKEKPAWTIQAAPGPATGPFHWRNRRLSIEELAALQTFPPTYRFPKEYRVAHRQIGNAVPCALGELVGLEIRRQLFGERVREKLKLIPKARNDCPGPHPVLPVPAKYQPLRGTHAPHPGTGLGPSPRRRG